MLTGILLSIGVLWILRLCGALKMLVESVKVVLGRFE